MRKAQECMIMTMTIDNWLELELIRGINDEPCRETEVEADKKRWINHFRQSKKSPAQSQDLDGEGRKRSVWWHAFLIKMGDIELDDTNYD